MVPKCYVLFPWFRNSVLFTQFIIIIIIIIIIVIIIIIIVENKRLFCQSADQSPVHTTRIRFHLKTQLFLFGYGFRPYVSNENVQ